MQCNSSEESPVIIFVSKMFAIERTSLPQNRPKVLTSEEIAARRELARQRLADKLAKPSEVTTDIKEVDGEPLPDNEDTNSFEKDNNDNNVNKPEDDDAFIAFARVYSGTLKKGKKLYILGPKYDPVIGMEKVIDKITKTLFPILVSILSPPNFLNLQYPNGEGIDPLATLKDLKSGQHLTVATIDHLYQLMGRELEELEDVPAGNILGNSYYFVYRSITSINVVFINFYNAGIGGLDDHILKTATISSTLACPPFTDLNLIAVPILRVAVEPARTSDMGALVNGLRLLNQADPCVQILVQETGEHVLITAGEVHLQRCVDDLRHRYFLCYFA